MKVIPLELVTIAHKIMRKFGVSCTAFGVWSSRGFNAMYYHSYIII